MIPDFAGKVIEIVKIDYALQLWTADNWFIRLSSPVLASGPRTPPLDIDVNVPDSPLPPELADLVGSTISQMLVAEEGHLILQFDDRQLLARAKEDSEAWEIAGRDGELLICTPGGELTYFPPVPGIGEPRGSEPTPAEGAPSPPIS